MAEGTSVDAPHRRLLAGVLALLLALPVTPARAAGEPTEPQPPAPVGRLPGDVAPPVAAPPGPSSPTPVGGSAAGQIPTPPLGFDPGVAGPFSTAGQFGSRYEAYLQLLAARARAATLAPLLADGARGVQARAEFLRSSLSGFQAQMDLAERAGRVGPMPAPSTPLDSDSSGVDGRLTDVRLTVPSLGLSAGALPALPGLPSLSDATAGSASARYQLASSLLRMPSLADVSGGRAIDPAAFVAGRAGVVDACRAAISGRVSAAAATAGRPGEPDRCAGTPVGIAYREGPVFDPAAFRARLDQLAAGPPQSLLDRHRGNQDKAAAPPAPPKLPRELTRSISQCRGLDNMLDSAGAQYVPPAAAATNLIEHLCLLAWQ